MVPAPLSTRFQSFTPLPTIKLGPSGAGSQVGGPVHALGSCEAGSLSCCRPNPHGSFQSEVCLSYAVCFTPHRSSWFICVLRRSACPVLRHSESGPLGLSVRECGTTGSASGQTACPVGPTLHQSWSRHGHASPLCPGCLSPPLLPVWMNVYFLFPWCQTSLRFDFLSVLVVRGGTVCLPMPPSWC